MTLRSSELDEVLVVKKTTEQIQVTAATDGRQRIAISASTTQSLESSAGVLLSTCCLHCVFQHSCLNAFAHVHAKLLFPTDQSYSDFSQPSDTWWMLLQLF